MRYRLDLKSVGPRARKLRDTFRRRCLGLEEAVEAFPWGGAGVYKRRGKIFASADFNGSAYEVAFKPPLGEREDALALPFVRVAEYVGRYGWVQARLTSLRQLEVIWPWIAAAHALLAGKRRA